MLFSTLRKADSLFFSLVEDHIEFTWPNRTFIFSWWSQSYHLCNLARRFSKGLFPQMIYSPLVEIIMIVTIYFRFQFIHKLSAFPFDYLLGCIPQALYWIPIFLELLTLPHLANKLTRLKDRWWVFFVSAKWEKLFTWDRNLLLIGGGGGGEIYIPPTIFI